MQHSGNDKSVQKRNISLMFFVLVVFFELLSLFLAVLLTFALSAIVNLDFTYLAVISSVIVILLTGCLLSFINRRYFLRSRRKTVLYIILSSLILCAAFFPLCLRCMVPYLLYLFLQKFWGFILFVKEDLDPYPYLKQGNAYLPIMFLSLPISYCIGDYLLKKREAQEKNSDGK